MIMYWLNNPSLNPIECLFFTRFTQFATQGHKVSLQQRFWCCRFVAFFMIFWTFLIQSSSNQVESSEVLRLASRKAGSLITCHKRWNLGRSLHTFGWSWCREINVFKKAFPTVWTLSISTSDINGCAPQRTFINVSAHQMHVISFAQDSGGAFVSSSHRSHCRII